MPMSIVVKKNQKIAAVMISIFVVALLAVFLAYRALTSPEFAYLAIDCEILSVNGKSVFSEPAFRNCDFAADGGLVGITASDSKLAALKSDGTKVQSNIENLRSVVHISAQQDKVFGVFYRLAKAGAESAADPCVFKRARTDLSGSEQWCVGDHLEELKRAGFDISRPAISMNAMKISGQEVVKEIGEISSVTEITDGRLKDIDPAFATGNFLINLRSPAYGLLVLDSELKSILWSTDLRQVDFEGHKFAFFSFASTFTESGKILLYVNFSSPDVKPDEFPLVYAFDGGTGAESVENFRLRHLGSSHSRLVLYDIASKRIADVCVYEPEHAFDTFYGGAVTALKGGGYFAANLTYGGEAFLMNSECHLQWKFRNPSLNRRGMPKSFDSIRPMIDTAFLKSRKII